MSGSFLEKDLIMCCPAASVYILWYIMHHSINSMQNHSFHKRLSCLRLHTDFCDYVNSFPRDIQRLCCENHGLGRTACGFGKPVAEFFEFRKSAMFFWKICQTFLGKSASFFWEVCHQLRKSIAYFGKIRHRLWGNPPPTLNQRPTLGKWATDFGKISHRLWGKLSPILGKCLHRF